LASAITVSLVLRSPSTTARLKLTSTACRSAWSSARASTAASVVITPSIVAIIGSIIPDPLHMPPTVTARPSISRRSAICLSTVSVVRIACAASSPPAGLSAAAALRAPSRMRSIGSSVPMTPVEQTSTSASSTPSAPATAAAMARASAIPCSPVQALAQPLLSATARARPAAIRSRSRRTGAAATWFVVNTAAAAAGVSATTSAKSLRSLYLMAAATPAARYPRAAVTPPATCVLVAMICLCSGIRSKREGSMANPHLESRYKSGVQIRVPANDGCIGFDPDCVRLPSKPFAGNIPIVPLRLHRRLAGHPGSAARPPT